MGWDKIDPVQSAIKDRQYKIRMAKQEINNDELIINTMRQIDSGKAKENSEIDSPKTQKNWKHVNTRKDYGFDKDAEYTVAELTLLKLNAL